MINPAHDPSLAATVWFWRARAHWRAAERARQIDEATEMLRQHAATLERFLDDPAAPAELKRLLIGCSDAMADKETAEKFVRWAATRPLNEPVDTEDSRATERALAEMRGHRPDLVDDFATAAFTAVISASLRWPETADSFEKAFPRLVATPRRDVAIACTAISFRTGVPFSIKSPEHVMA